MLFVNCRQPSSHVRRDFQRQPYVHSACAFDEILERFSFYKLHRVEVTAPGFTQMEDRRNIRVANARRYPGFAQKPKPGRFITQVSLADDLQCDKAVQIDVERLVSHPHRTTTQFERFPVFARHQLVVVKSFRWLVRYRLDRFLESRLARHRRARESPAKHAYRAKFHRSRKFIAAARAGALGLRFHGSDSPSKAIKASQRAWFSSSACSGAWESGAWL